METMQLVGYGKALDNNVFKSSRIPKPSVKPGYVIIKVVATSLNPLDYKIRSGLLGAAGPELPAVLHCDVAGIVEEVGAGVSRFKVGDKVFGCPGGVTGRPGALSEFMLAQEEFLAHAPKSLPLASAAALPLVAITAWQGLIKYAQLQPGQKVLVFGATGGVGHIAIQLSKSLGATVVATASSERKAEVAKELGAAAVVNYQQQDIIKFTETYTNGKGFDVVFDTAGGDNLSTSMQTVAMGGQLIATWLTGPIDLMPLFLKGASLHLVFMPNPLLTNIGCDHYGRILEEIAKLVDQQQLKPLIDQQRFSFADVAKAHHYAECGQMLGKIVLHSCGGSS